MIRIMNTLVTAGQMNTQARAHYEEYFNKLKGLVNQVVGSIYVEENAVLKHVTPPKINMFHCLHYSL